MFGNQYFYLCCYTASDLPSLWPQTHEGEGGECVSRWCRLFYANRAAALFKDWLYNGLKCVKYSEEAQQTSVVTVFSGCWQSRKRPHRSISQPNERLENMMQTTLHVRVCANVTGAQWCLELLKEILIKPENCASRLDNQVSRPVCSTSNTKWPFTYGNKTGQNLV